jgi:probable rRNA maturation factor
MMKTFPDPPEDLPNEPFSLSNISGITIPAGEESFKKLIRIVENHEDVHFQSVELVFVTEEEILRINREYLGHDYVTDIITFGYNDRSDTVEATLFCCAPRILEQSREFGTEPSEEFLRVFVHGLIHLAGYDDQSDSNKAAMTRLENKYLELFGKAE